jgi:hypothetical protein
MMLVQEGLPARQDWLGMRAEENGKGVLLRASKSVLLGFWNSNQVLEGRAMKCLF